MSSSSPSGAAMIVSVSDGLGSTIGSSNGFSGLLGSFKGWLGFESIDKYNHYINIGSMTVFDLGNICK